MGRIETETLDLPENRAALADLNGQWIDRFHDRNGFKYIVLDMDSSAILDAIRRLRAPPLCT